MWKGSHLSLKGSRRIYYIQGIHKHSMSGSNPSCWQQNVSHSWARSNRIAHLFIFFSAVRISRGVTRTHSHRSLICVHPRNRGVCRWMYLSLRSLVWRGGEGTITLKCQPLHTLPATTESVWIGRHCSAHTSAGSALSFASARVEPSTSATAATWKRACSSNRYFGSRSSALFCVARLHTWYPSIRWF